MRLRYATPAVSALLALSMGALFAATATAPTVPPAVNISTAAATTPEAIEQRLQGKTLFLRGFYLDDHLEFGTDGKVEGNPARGSFTLSGVEVKKVHFTKHSVEIEGDRVGLHFFGALPYEDDSTPYESIKVAGKPVEITIERLVIEPEKKKKKSKEKDQAKAAKDGKGGASVAVTEQKPTEGERTGVGLTENDIANSPAEVEPSALKPQADTAKDSAAHHDPKESYVVLSAALDKIFATAVDQSVIDTLPGYWQTYFATKAGKVRSATDAAALRAGGDVKAPHLLTMINPDSNDYAQKSGIAGMILLQTVVSPSGKPGQVTIVRPIGFGLDEKAVEAVERAQFRPGTQDGKVVPVLVNLDVTFRIYSDRTRPKSGSAPSQVAQKAAPAPELHATGATTVAAATLK